MKVMNIFWKYIKNRLPVLMLSLCLVTGAVASAVYGKYVTDETDEASFDVVATPNLDLQVSESDDDDTDSEYKYTITNSSTSNIPTYVRFTVVVNWVQEGTEEIWFLPPVEGVDYEIKTPYTKVGGYYYYNGEVVPGFSFGVNVSQLKSKDGYTLQVSVLAESIQCVPATAVEDAWGVTFNGTNWVKSTAPIG